MGVTTDQEFDGLRTPPQDVEAEESVLGAMILSKDAIADCVESMSGDDFYRPAHETIYEAILDLSLFVHIGQYPSVDLEPLAMAWLTGAAVILTVIGSAGFRRRNLITA